MTAAERKKIESSPRAEGTAGGQFHYGDLRNVRAASLILVPVLYFTDGFVHLDWPWGIVEGSLLGMDTANAVAFTLHFVLVDHAGPAFSSFTANMVTLFGVFWGIVILSEENSIRV